MRSLPEKKRAEAAGGRPPFPLMMLFRKETYGIERTGKKNI
jgi:hypothetical protein